MPAETGLIGNGCLGIAQFRFLDPSSDVYIFLFEGLENFLRRFSKAESLARLAELTSKSESLELKPAMCISMGELHPIELLFILACIAVTTFSVSFRIFLVSYGTSPFLTECLISLTGPLWSNFGGNTDVRFNGDWSTGGVGSLRRCLGTSVVGEGVLDPMLSADF